MNTPNIEEVKQSVLDKVTSCLLHSGIDVITNQDAKEILYQVKINMDAAYNIGAFDMCMEQQEKIRKEMIKSMGA